MFYSQISFQRAQNRILILFLSKVTGIFVSTANYIWTDFSCIVYSASDFSTFVKFAYVWDLVIKKIAILSKNVSSNISKSTSDIKRAKTYDIKHTELS